MSSHGWLQLTRTPLEALNTPIIGDERGRRPNCILLLHTAIMFETDDI